MVISSDGMVQCFAPVPHQLLAGMASVMQSVISGTVLPVVDFDDLLLNVGGVDVVGFIYCPDNVVDGYDGFF